MKRKVKEIFNEYLNPDGEWIEFNGYFDVHSKAIRRHTINFDNGSKVVKYFKGRTRHRLDGPAQIWINKTGKTDGRIWYVEGFSLRNFLYRRQQKHISAKYIFQYIKDHPVYVNEIITLSRYNKWLDEDQILLIKTMQTFT